MGQQKTVSSVESLQDGYKEEIQLGSVELSAEFRDASLPGYELG
jgi:hypothetical protein